MNKTYDQLKREMAGLKLPGTMDWVQYVYLEVNGHADEAAAMRELHQQEMADLLKLSAFSPQPPPYPSTPPPPQPPLDLDTKVSGDI
jgi:hypothetical protein